MSSIGTSAESEQRGAAIGELDRDAFLAFVDLVGADLDEIVHVDEQLRDAHSQVQEAMALAKEKLEAARLMRNDRVISEFQYGEKIYFAGVWLAVDSEVSRRTSAEFIVTQKPVNRADENKYCAYEQYTGITDAARRSH